MHGDFVVLSGRLNARQDRTTKCLEKATIRSHQFCLPPLQHRPADILCQLRPKGEHRCQKMLHHLLRQSLHPCCLFTALGPRECLMTVTTSSPGWWAAASRAALTGFAEDKFLSLRTPKWCQGFLTQIHGHAGGAVSSKHHHIQLQAGSFWLPKAREDPPRNPLDFVMGNNQTPAFVCSRGIQSIII